MGANATGVSAHRRSDSRLDDPRYGSGQDEDAQRWPGRQGWIVSGPFIVVAALIAAGATLLWFDREVGEVEAGARATGRLEMVASLAAHEITAATTGRHVDALHLQAGIAKLPEIAVNRSRSFFLSDQDGAVVAAEGLAGRAPRRMSDLFGSTVEPLEPGHATRVTLSDGTPAIATARRLGSGRLTVVQPWSAVLDERGASDRTLAVVGAMVLLSLLVLAAGCAGQAGRARQVSRIFARLRSRLDSSLAQGHCGLWDWDVTAARVTWSPSLFRLLGYEPRHDGLSLSEVGAIVHAADHERLSALVRDRSRPGADRIEQDVRALTASGSWRWLRLRAELVTDAVDGHLHAYGIASDVTEEHGAREARAGQDRRLAEALEALSEAFVLWDADERLILCNSKWSALHGVPPELTAPGTSHAAIAAASLQPITPPRMTRTALGGAGTRTTETRLSDGRWIHVSERPTLEGGVVSVGTDVSDLKANEARLQEAERRLKKSVRVAETKAQRLAAIAEKNLEASQAKTEFLARMSHELRTPLTAIIGFADMMRQEILGPLGAGRYLEYTHDIHRSGLKLLDVIDGILQMSRLETGRFHLAPALLAVSDAVDRALGCVGREIEGRRLQVHVDVPEPALIHADERALHEILVQLLRNATRFARDGGNVRVRVRRAAGRMNIFVEDDGVGIPADVIPRLGRPFEQIESEYSRSGGGTGLGLAIARGLTELHDGRLRVRSEPGAGTVVLVHLPLVQFAANDPAAAEIAPVEPRRLQLVARH